MIKSNDIISSNKNESIMTPANSPEEGNSKRAFTIGILILLLVVASIAWFYLVRPASQTSTVTPEQTLEMLNTSSVPDTTTRADKAAIMAELKKGSAAPTMTTEESLQLLTTLNK